MLTVSFAAQADGWKPEAIALARSKYTQPPMPDYDAQRDPYVATLWGAASRKTRLALPLEQYHREIPLPAHFDRSVGVEFSQHFGQKLIPNPDPRRRIPVVQKFLEKAPLLVFVPGIFSDSSDITGQMTIKWFSEMGYHVLVVPNPMGPQYLMAGPHATQNPAINDARFVIDAGRYAVEHWIGTEWVTGVAIAGESLGAAVAAAAYAEDSLDAYPLFTKGASLFWPPINLTHSMGIMDKMIGATQQKYENVCKNLLTDFRFKVRVFFAQILNGPTEQERDCASSIVMQFGYRSDLLRTARILKTGVDPGASDIDHPIEAQDDFERSLDFEVFIHNLAPFYAETLNENNPINSLAYWLGMANQHNHSDWRIFTSIDDFVNTGETWKEIYDLDPQGNRLLIMPWGGHIGLTATDPFPAFLSAQMGQ